MILVFMIWCKRHNTNPYLPCQNCESPHVVGLAFYEFCIHLQLHLRPSKIVRSCDLRFFRAHDLWLCVWLGRFLDLRWKNPWFLPKSYLTWPLFSFVHSINSVSLRASFSERRFLNLSQSRTKLPISAVSALQLEAFALLSTLSTIFDLSVLIFPWPSSPSLSAASARFLCCPSLSKWRRCRSKGLREKKVEGGCVFCLLGYKNWIINNTPTTRTEKSIIPPTDRTDKQKNAIN